jgi:hypothetical protein
MLSVLVLGMLLVVGGAAGADPAAPVSACTMNDKRLNELSGMVADADHWYAINDGGTKSIVYVLNKQCQVEKLISNPLDPYDVEDLARGSDGTFWLSDTGDNNKQRSTVALIAMTPAGKATLYRLTYPDGAHDTEALLLDRNNVPYLITKTLLGTAEIYRPARALASPGPTPLEHVGSLKVGPTDTPGGPVPGMVGSALVTGAASTMDGSVVAVRTYTDAYLFPVPDGDLLAALGREPVRVPLPNERQGEAIAFNPDGSLVSGSEGVGEPIRIVAGAAALVTPKPAAAPGGGGAAPAGSSEAPADKKGVPTLPIVLAVVVIALLVLVVLGRRRRAR